MTTGTRTSPMFIGLFVSGTEEE